MLLHHQKREIDNFLFFYKKFVSFFFSVGVILDQSKICGIGVAWGSEILYNAKLNPDLKACEQSLDKLVDSMIEIRTQIQNTYIGFYLYNHYDYDNKDNLKELINDWFENLYKIRKMNIYKKGTKIQISGRSWWI